MLEYSFLLIASVILAVIILWLYRAIVGAGKAVYYALLPSSKDNLTAHIPEQSMGTTVNDTPTPWGWGHAQKSSHVSRAAVAKPEAKAPWGWKGNDHEIRDHHPGKPQPTAKAPSKAAEGVGWPYREDKFEFAGKAYKVTRKVKPKKTNLKTSSKPWGW